MAEKARQQARVDVAAGTGNDGSHFVCTQEAASTLHALKMPSYPLSRPYTLSAFSSGVSLGGGGMSVQFKAPQFPVR